MAVKTESSCQFWFWGEVELGRFYSRGVPLSFPIVTVKRSLNLATETKDVGEKNKSGTDFCNTVYRLYMVGLQ